MKKIVLFFLIVCLCTNLLFFLSSCNDTEDSKENQLTEETEKVELLASNTIMKFHLFSEIKEGMTYEQVKTKLNNPGEPSSRVGYTYAYRLEDGYVAFIKFGGTSPNSKVESLKIEPLVESSCFEYAVNLIETQGKAALQTDFWGTTGIHVGSGGDIHEYYLSDGRIVAVTYEYTGMNGGPVAVSAVVDRIWFEP